MLSTAVQALRLVCWSFPTFLVSAGRTGSAANDIVFSLALVCKALSEAAMQSIYEVIQLEASANQQNEQLARTLLENPALASQVRTIRWHCQEGGYIAGSSLEASGVAVLSQCPDVTSLLINPFGDRMGPWLEDVYNEMPFRDRLCAIEVTTGGGMFPLHLSRFISSAPKLRHFILRRLHTISSERVLLQNLPDLHIDAQLTYFSLHDDVSRLPLREVVKYLESAHKLKVLQFNLTTASGFSAQDFLNCFKYLRMKPLRCLMIGDISQMTPDFQWARFLNCFPNIQILGIKHDGRRYALSNLFSGLGEASCLPKLRELDIESTSSFSLQNFGFLIKMNLQHLTSFNLMGELPKFQDCVFPAGTIDDLDAFQTIIKPLIVQEMQSILRVAMLPTHTVFRIARKTTPLYRFTRAQQDLEWVNEEFEGNDRVWTAEWNKRFQGGTF